MIRRGSGLLQGGGVLVLLCLLAALTVAAALRYGDLEIPFALLGPLLLGVVLLDNRLLAGFSVLVILAVGVEIVLGRPDMTMLVCLGIVVVLALLVLWLCLRGRPIGVTGRRGESMLVDLRDRILAQGQIPSLPASWLVESSLSSAGGSPFAGDFVVATTREHGRLLEVAVVDVSGKGEAAGTRALQLSGAMGGLLGALRPEQFLPAANDYLIQREWDEGFATAVHLSIDLGDGRFEVRSAGHPPAALRHAGSGRWEVLRAEGPVLGLIDDATYDVVHGRLMPGDTLLLYTDGMVEEPRRDIDLGIDAMLGAVESMVRTAWDGMAVRLTASVGSRDDDRALMLVHHR
ncbi:PP2C family protein-serine/threonine phosphatase [Nocardioides panacisoli]|uniref:PPM-type phosphatase domain-containing protein n=1 Tax=Nocardioides panacisoli TaxID=627624 RepID=A0ABP7I0W4_9ACTN